MSATTIQQTNSSCPECSPQALKLREHTDHATLSSLYNTRAEIDLSQAGVSLGAIAALPRLDNPTLIDLHQAFPGKAVLWVVGHISLLNAASGASNRMDDPSLNLCALDIITSFPFITMGELCVFCARMRSLRYVQKRSDYVFSSDTIMQGMREFMRERQDEIARYEREVVTPPTETTGIMSHEEAVQTEEYKQQMEKEKQTTGDGARHFGWRDIGAERFGRLVTQPMSEEEFRSRQEELIAKMKAKYDL